jgi:elongation factor 1-beta
VDLFGSDDEEEDAEAERVKQERLKAYAEKKATKPKTIAKSLVTLDVKPWDDETDMKALEASVRSIDKDGLVWGSSTLVPVGTKTHFRFLCVFRWSGDLGFGIRKLQITLVVEDDKISLEELQEEIEAFEDYVQSTDIAAMAKL